MKDAPFFYALTSDPARHIFLDRLKDLAGVVSASKELILSGFFGDILAEGLFRACFGACIILYRFISFCDKDADNQRYRIEKVYICLYARFD